MRTGRWKQWLVWWSGIVLISLGIGALIWSRLLVSESQAPVRGWWQGTLQALGVGLIVGGLVDVLALTGLNRVIGTRAAVNSGFATMLVSRDQYEDRDAYDKAFDAFVWKNWWHVQYLDRKVRKLLDARISDRFRMMLGSADQYEDRDAYEKALDTLVWHYAGELRYLDQDVRKALDASGAEDRVLPPIGKGRHPPRGPGPDGGPP